MSRPESPLINDPIRVSRGAIAAAFAKHDANAWHLRGPDLARWIEEHCPFDAADPEARRVWVEERRRATAAPAGDGQGRLFGEGR